MKWFSIEGIRTEIERIRWPKGKEFGTSIGDVLAFTCAFAVFFAACDFVVAGLLRIVGA